MKPLRAAIVVLLSFAAATASAQESTDAAPAGRFALTATMGGADFQPGFMLASGPYATAGAAISGRITSRLEIELSMARPITAALEGSRVHTVYPWGRAGMTTAEVLQSGGVDYTSTEVRDIEVEGALMARWRLRRWKRVQPALLAGVGWQSVNITQTTQVVRGTQESFRLETLTFPMRSRRETSLATGFEVAIPLTRRVELVPQFRTDIKPYADASPDYVFRSGVGLRWRF